MPSVDLQTQIKELELDDSVELSNSDMLPCPQAPLVLPPTSDAPNEKSLGKVRAVRSPLRVIRVSAASAAPNAQDEGLPTFILDSMQAVQTCSVLLQPRRCAAPEFASVQLRSPLTTARVPASVPLGGSAVLPIGSGTASPDVLSRTLPGSRFNHDGRLAWSSPTTPMCPSPIAPATTPISARFGWAVPTPRVFKPMFTPRVPAPLAPRYMVATGRSNRRL